MKFILAEVTFGSVSPPMVLLLAVVTFGYARRVRTLAKTPRRVGVARQIAFYGAIFLLVAEPLSPLGASDDNSFLSHMLEHLMIGDLAALLMVLGITGPLIQPLLKIKLIAALRPLTNPVVALVFWIANMYFWHLPVMFEAALNHDTVHVIQHMLFFSAGFNMWMALFGPLPQPAWFGNVAKLFYIIGVRLAGVLLGNVFVFSGTAYYQQYQHSVNVWGLSPVADQSVAGAVMMAEGTFISFVLFGWLFFKAANEGEKSQQLLDLANEHGVELSDARSARAAAAGTTEMLRERIVSGLDKPEN
ncbi:MAG: cytochrome c oxidase assembly protein [Solirubrobacterales bacterium]